MSRRPAPRPSELRNVIRRLREEHGTMSQQALADRAGVSRQTIIAIEAGRYSPSLLLAFQIARAFGKRIDEVFLYEP